MEIPIEVSARHIHLSQKDLEALFGKNYKLKVLHKISEPNQFAAKETLTLIHRNNKIGNVRIIGPARKSSQAEISMTDAHKLAIEVPIRVSGDIKNCPKIIARNNKNNKSIKILVIIAKRHLHLSEQQAKELNLKNHQVVSIKVSGKRGLIFDNVVVRAGNKHWLSFQLDTDEANAAGIKGKCFGELII